MRRYLLTVIGLVLLLCLLAALGTASGSPDTFTVNTTDDTDDGTCDTAHCSLREAIEAANNNPGSDTIEFNIPVTDTGYMVSGVTGTWTISLTASLPTLSGGGTIISGTTQAAFIGGDPNPYGPEVEITGASMASGHCLSIRSADNVIHGLVINRCPSDGISISSSSATTNTISGNYIGTDALGSSDLGNSKHGVYIQGGAQNNTIGGDTPGERNIISGNDERGVVIRGTGTMSNTVSGNYIGTDVAGSSDLGNGQDGVFIYDSAQNNTIGGATPGESNIIAFNVYNGVGVYGYGATTTGNTITQNSIHSNSGLGIDLASGGNTELSPPTISSADCFSAYSGTAPNNATVELFTGPDDEGRTYLTTVLADDTGIWSVIGSFTLDTYVTATATDASGNTSEFSAAVLPGTCYRIYLPLTLKNY